MACGDGDWVDEDDATVGEGGGGGSGGGVGGRHFSCTIFEADLHGTIGSFVPSFEPSDVSVGASSR